MISLRANSLLASFQLFNVDEVVVVFVVAVKLNKSSTFGMRCNGEKSLANSKSGDIGLSGGPIDAVNDLGVDGASL